MKKNFVTAETLTNIINALDTKAKDLFDFDYYKEDDDLKFELIDAIQNNSVDIKLLYKFFAAIK